MTGTAAGADRPQRYNHRALEPQRRVLRWLIDNVGWRFLVHIARVEGRENFPLEGPAVAIYNHIAFVDPIVALGNLPRNVVPLAKVEAYSYPLIGIIPRLWAVIPVRRGEVDRQALAQARAVLAAGEVILVAPEGTRSPALIQAREGMALLADRSGAPVVPIAIEGTERFPTRSLKTWRREGATVRIGRAFRFRPSPGGKADRERLRLMTDEAMYVLAALLSEKRRGYYSDLSKATSTTIEFA
ncbi:MAG TPA: lysophospholipid acyltransferase family protein [Anaerolineales bacterium]|nr:lysophospholipid acyltransferase family protein [Anaerolineales bacterium]